MDLHMYLVPHACAESHDVLCAIWSMMRLLAIELLQRGQVFTNIAHCQNFELERVRCRFGNAPC